jgi:hypothetical protein
VIVHFAYAALLVFATTFVHAGCTAGMLGWLRGVARRHWAMRNAMTRAAVIAALVMVMAFASYLESAIWAGFYVWVGALTAFDEAMYFSLVTYTTLGYGDVTLGSEWRVLAAFQAANGIIMFGWTTALIAAVAQRLYFRNEQGTPDS